MRILILRGRRAVRKEEYVNISAHPAIARQINNERIREEIDPSILEYMAVGRLGQKRWAQS